MKKSDGKNIGFDKKKYSNVINRLWYLKSKESNMETYIANITTPVIAKKLLSHEKFQN